MATLAPLAELSEPVPVGSDLYQEWKAYHELRGWPFVPDPGRQPVVYFPRGGPSALGQFDEAAQAVLRKERGNEHAA